MTTPAFTCAITGMPAAKDDYNHWYAVNTFTGREEKVRRIIGNLFEDCRMLFPKRLLSIRKQAVTRVIEKPLFPGYFFIKTRDPIYAQQARTILDACYLRCNSPIKNIRPLSN